MLLARISIGGRGARVDPVVKPDTTVGVVPAGTVDTDGTGALVPLAALSPAADTLADPCT